MTLRQYIFHIRHAGCSRGALPCWYVGAPSAGARPWVPRGVVNFPPPGAASLRYALAMNAPFDLIATVHRIGGPADAGPRQFGGSSHRHTVPPNFPEFGIDLRSTDSAAWSMYLVLGRLQPAAQEDWWAGSFRLQTVNGMDVGGWRPFVFYGKPWPVPTYTSVWAPEFQAGLFQVGLQAATPVHLMEGWEDAWGVCPKCHQEANRSHRDVCQGAVTE